MNLNCVSTKIIIFSVIISLTLFTTGCTENMKSNSTERQETTLGSPTLLTTPQVSIVPLTQNQPLSPSITIKTTVSPHFSGTISYGSNRSSALTEDQAWMYAEAFFQKAGMIDIQQSEIVALGQGIWKDKDNNQKMVWTFSVNRIVNRVNIGGIITIDAYDGHVVSFSGFE